MHAVTPILPAKTQGLRRSVWILALAGLLAGTAWLVFRPARPAADSEEMA